MAEIEKADGSSSNLPGDAVTEKQVEYESRPAGKANQLHEFQENEGYVVDAEEAGVGTAKLAKDGRTRLIPQPSDDPNDPLNWSTTKKHIILFIIAFASFLPDYGSATGAVTLIPQAA